MNTQTLLNKYLERSVFSPVSISLYDIAWVVIANVLPVDEQSILIKKIKNQVYKDGSWGAKNFYLHDRVINTLACIVALKSINDDEAHFIKNGEDFLNNHIPELLSEEIETIGFELNFVSLLQKAQLLGLNLIYTHKVVKYYLDLGVKKKSLIPKELFLKTTTISHSLEAFGSSEINYHDVMPFPNGAMGNSPAATAAYISKVDFSVEKSMEYLFSFKKNNWDIPSIYPFEIFDYAWIIFTHQHYFSSTKVSSSVKEYLLKHLKKFYGASISNTFPLIDSDDTAVLFVVLSGLGEELDFSIFEQFEEQNHFRCFEFERNPSLSANIHVLHALQYAKLYNGYERVKEKLIEFLSNAQKPDGSFLDKWHVSPYYCTSHAIIAIEETNSIVRKKAIDFLLRKQEEIIENNLNLPAEELSYIVLGLSQDNLISDEFSSLFLKTENNYDELWVDKGLYCPLNVVAALVAFSKIYVQNK